MSNRYLVPDGTTQIEYEIKKSRFIARLHFADSREQAMAELAQAKADYPDARHHCWAYQIGPPQSPYLVAMSDDGEPGGTAGKPILNVVQHKSIGHAMLIVIRYFGGIKLGAGGLVRAYSHAAQQAYDEAKTREQVQLDEYRIQCDFSDEQVIRHWLGLNAGKLLTVQYTNCVVLSIAIDETYLEDLKRLLAGMKGASLGPLN